jgi:hypothetical protein
MKFHLSHIFVYNKYLSINFSFCKIYIGINISLNKYLLKKLDLNIHTRVYVYIYIYISIFVSCLCLRLARLYSRDQHVIVIKAVVGLLSASEL